MSYVDVDLNGYQVNIVEDGRPYPHELRRLAREFELKVQFWVRLDNKSAELRDLYEKSSVSFTGIFHSQDEDTYAG